MTLGLDHIGMGLVEDSNVAIWVSDFLLTFPPLLIVWDSTPISALAHVSSLDDNDPLLPCVYGISFIVACVYRILFIAACF